jgi:hypothetical protein
MGRCFTAWSGTHPPMFPRPDLPISRVRPSLSLTDVGFTACGDWSVPSLAARTTSMSAGAFLSTIGILYVAD